MFETAAGGQLAERDQRGDDSTQSGAMMYARVAYSCQIEGGNRRL